MVKQNVEFVIDLLIIKKKLEAVIEDEEDFSSMTVSH